ncbi:MAG: hypothetical protein GF417_09495 [Candidatus Latescibacteria bacterium]|nr:hypothetical protein [bacterium]MBD3424658.1 hypothetical protein [Candidatus Latescibacterota bacterium]
MKRKIIQLMAAVLMITVIGCSEEDKNDSVVPEQDTDPPGISATFPADSATDVTRSGPFWVLFDESMNEQSVEDTCTFIPAVGMVFYDNYWNGDTLFFSPNSILTGGTNHMITIGAGSKDLAGNRMGTDYELFFTTTSEEDTDPPQVVSTSPLDGATGVTPTIDIEITFNEPVQAPSYDWDTQGFFSISPEYPEGGYILTQGNTLILGQVELDQDTEVTVSISDVTDLAGNPLASMYTFSFETAVDNTRPYLVSSNPSNGSTGIPPSINQLELVFSEPMNQNIEPDSVDARIINAVTATNSDPEWDSADSVLTINLNQDVIGTGTTYWVYFMDAMDKAGNYIDPNPTYYRFTTAGTADYFPVEEDLYWYFNCTDSVPNYWEEIKYVDNYNPASGTFDLITLDVDFGVDTSEVWHMQKTPSSLLFLSLRQYEEGNYQETWTWATPLEYMKLPLQDHLGESWSFSTTFEVGGETADISGTVTLGDQFEIMPADPESEFAGGSFHECILHMLEVEMSAGEETMSIEEQKWFAPAFGCFKSISAEVGSDTTQCELLYWGPDL